MLGVENRFFVVVEEMWLRLSLYVRKEGRTDKRLRPQSIVVKVVKRLAMSAIAQCLHKVTNELMKVGESD